MIQTKAQHGLSQNLLKPSENEEYQFFRETLFINNSVTVWVFCTPGKYVFLIGHKRVETWTRGALQRAHRHLV